MNTTSYYSDDQVFALTSNSTVEIDDDGYSYFHNTNRDDFNDFTENIVDDELPFINLGEDISLPKELVNCNKLFNHMIHMEQKVHPYAIKAAFATLIGALMARWVYSPTGTSTALYMLVIAKTGSGKNVALSTVEQIFESLDMNEILVASQISSVGALDDLFFESPVVVNIVDEFGDVLSGMRRGNQKQLATAMKKVYSSTINSRYRFGKYSSSGGKVKKEERSPIERPYYAVLGLTTSEQFFEASNINMLNDGFLNRFIVLNGEDIKPIFNSLNIQRELPIDIRNHIEHLIKRKLYIGSLLDESKDKPKKSCLPYPIEIDMTEEARDYYDNFIGDADLEGSDIYRFCSEYEAEEFSIGLKNLRRNISVRWRENAIRYATALAAYEGLDKIELYVLEYAYKFIKKMGIEFLNLFNNEVVMTKNEKLLSQVLEWFKTKQAESGSTTPLRFSLSTIAQNMYPLKRMKARERRAILDELVELGVLYVDHYGKAYEYSLVMDE